MFALCPPARLEAFGVSTLEAMKAGFPTIVTESTGTKDEVLDVDESLVTSADTYDISETVKEFFIRDIPKKRKISSKFTNKTSDIGDRKYSVEKFKEAIRDLLVEM